MKFETPEMEKAINFRNLPYRRNSHSDCQVSLQNKDKNRYEDVLPNDEHRVVLAKKCNDYINMSRVDIGIGEILCGQGPLQSTAYDFWKTVYDTQTTLIVMLTQFRENGTVKCAKYLPADEEIFWCNECFEDPRIQVSRTSRYESESIITSSYEIKIDSQIRSVDHMHILNWGDFQGAPSSLSSIISQIIRRIDMKEKVILHCSAGVGRTGTVAAILRKHYTNETTDQAIIEIRKCRAGLVATQDQYDIVDSFSFE